MNKEVYRLQLVVKKFISKCLRYQRKLYTGAGCGERGEGLGGTQWGIVALSLSTYLSA